MYTSYKYILFIPLLAILISSCEQEMITYPAPLEDNNDNVGPDPVAGNADFTKFVSVGASLVAGYQSGAFYQGSQDNSLPAILNRQFAQIPGQGGGSSTFNQPNINTDLGYNSLFSNPEEGEIFGRFVLTTGEVPLSALPADASVLPAPPNVNPAFQYDGDRSALNNFAVPGITVGQALIPETGDWSLFQQDPRVQPYYARFASDPGTSTVAGDMIAAQGTFFLCWLGNNDVLGYAIGGASEPSILTSPEDFQTRYAGLMQALTADPDIRGVVGNIADVTTIPFFTALPYNFVALDESTVETLQPVVSGLNLALNFLVVNGVISQEEADSRKLNIAAGQNAALIVDEELTDIGEELANTDPRLAAFAQVRQATPNDLIAFPAALDLAALDLTDPTAIVQAILPDSRVLTADEIELIQLRVDAFNAAIPQVIESLGLSGRVAVANTNQVLTELASGAQFSNGVALDASFAPPFGSFSEDGVHPNTRGYAFVGNTFIEAINNKFGSTVPLIDVSTYNGTALPAQ